MPIRYEEASDDVRRLLDRVVIDHFGGLKNARIAALFDTKKHLAGGHVVLSNIMKPNELLRHFTKTEAGSDEGYDYVITIDKKAWEAMADGDRVRLLRHELRHTFFDIEAEDNPYKLMDHTVADFYEEIELNQDDPKWRLKISTLVADMYEQEKEEAKEERSKRKGRRGGQGEE